MAWDKEKIELLDWYHSLPKPWVGQYFESAEGGITLHIFRYKKEVDKDGDN